MPKLQRPKVWKNKTTKKIDFVKHYYIIYLLYFSERTYTSICLEKLFSDRELSYQQTDVVVTATKSVPSKVEP